MRDVIFKALAIFAIICGIGVLAYLAYDMYNRDQIAKVYASPVSYVALTVAPTRTNGPIEAIEPSRTPYPPPTQRATITPYPSATLFKKAKIPSSGSNSQSQAGQQPTKKSNKQASKPSSQQAGCGAYAYAMDQYQSDVRFYNQFYGISIDMYQKFVQQDLANRDAYALVQDQAYLDKYQNELSGALNTAEREYKNKVPKECR